MAWRSRSALGRGRQGGEPGIRSRSAASTGRLSRSGSRAPEGTASDGAGLLCGNVVEAMMSLGPSGVYAECTFGRGEHARAILSRLAPMGELLALDVDPLAIAEAKTLANEDRRFSVHHKSHSELGSVLTEMGVGRARLSGVLFGANEKDRGLLLRSNGHFDLRTNPHLGLSAARWLTTVDTAELAWIIREYSEDEDPLIAARIAETLVLQGQRQPFQTSGEIAEHICRVKHTQSRNAAKGTFQAIQTFLNCEPQQLFAGLMAAFENLEMGGRCVVLCSSRWEQVVARRFLREHEECDPRGVEGWPCERLTQLFPLLQSDRCWAAAEVCSPLAPSAAEGEANPRIRSCRAFVLEKIARRAPTLGMNTTWPHELAPLSPTALLQGHGREIPREYCCSGAGAPAPVPAPAPAPGSLELFCRPAGLPAFAGASPSPGPFQEKRQGTASLAGQCADPVQDASIGIRDWLLGIDGGRGCLVSYEDKIQQVYGSLLQIYRSSVRNGQVQDHFFEATGIEKLGHCRLFQRWFAKHPQHQPAQPVCEPDGGNPCCPSNCGENRGDLREVPKPADRGCPPLPGIAACCAGPRWGTGACEAMGLAASWEAVVERSGRETDAVPPLRTFVEMAQEFRVPHWLSSCLCRRGFRVTRPIQQHALPFALLGRDVLLSAPLGSGKTLAGLLPLLVSISESRTRTQTQRGLRSTPGAPQDEDAQWTGARSRPASGAAGGPACGGMPQASKPLGLLLSPSWELCQRIHREAAELCCQEPTAGAPALHVQLSTLAMDLLDCDLCITTLQHLQHFQQRQDQQRQDQEDQEMPLPFSSLRFLVLVAVDQMLEQGWGQQLQHLLTNRGLRSSRNRQTMMLAASPVNALRPLAAATLHDHVSLQWLPASHRGRSSGSTDRQNTSRPSVSDSKK